MTEAMSMVKFSSCGYLVVFFTSPLENETTKMKTCLGTPHMWCRTEFRLHQTHTDDTLQI